MKHQGKSVSFGVAFFSMWMAAIGWGADVQGHLNVVGQNGAPRRDLNNGAVIWLTPLTKEVSSELRAAKDAPHPVLLQKNKRFTPHVLVVQVGSVIDFPNRDPFFHNVFSYFNGKRFDLGLYEAGSTRSVHFDRTGICYVFCNIHPQMSAVIVVVDTPYFAMGNDQGDFRIPEVPAGNYRLHVWEEHCTPADLAAVSRELAVGQETVTIEPIKLRESQATVLLHPNKYGKEYDPEVYHDPIYHYR